MNRGALDMHVIAMAAIERELANAGNRVEVAVKDAVVGATVASYPLYDTEKKRPRS